jgi:hypothetical protein
MLLGSMQIRYILLIGLDGMDCIDKAGTGNNGDNH